MILPYNYGSDNRTQEQKIKDFNKAEAMRKQKATCLKNKLKRKNRNKK